MAHTDAPTADRYDRYWTWFAVALFLLLTVDILTSIGAAMRTDLSAEANPFMRWLLAQNVQTIVAVHLGILVVAVGGFRAVLYFLRRTPPPVDRYFARLFEVWLALLVGVGIFIFVNNMAVVVFRVSVL
ncbi:MAG: hypothetical protein ACLFM8_06435 [Halobacteriales archaeon]